MKRLYVTTVAQFDTYGRIRPLWIEWEDGRQYLVDKVLDVRRAASLKAGGAGIRFSCRFGRQVRSLYLDEDRWFVEMEENEPKV